jgi:hypothetical protein
MDVIDGLGTSALVACVGVVAFLYASVGHAGASGYIAVMSLFGLGAEVIRPTALVLNVAVATIATLQFWRAGHFSWPLFWPFALGGAPLAYVGGVLALPIPVFKVVVGLVLLYSAARLLAQPGDDVADAPPAATIGVATGAGLGLLAGLTGTGGGIFLTPILLGCRWARARTAAAVSAAFILLNSLAGLAGTLQAGGRVPSVAEALLVAAVAGGTAGSYVGSRQLSPALIKRLLAVVLVIAGGKLVLGR